MSVDIKSMPLLGFGLMRLPLKDGGAIDHEQLCRMVDKYMKTGIPDVFRTILMNDAADILDGAR